MHQGVDTTSNDSVGVPASTALRRTGISSREILMAIAGAALGLVIIGLVWFFAGRTSQPELPPVGETRRPAPAFELSELNGGMVRLSDYRGKVVLLNFWGTWCDPCKEETPTLQALHQELETQGLVIIGVNLFSQETQGEQAVRAFLNSYAVSYPIALDKNGDAARSYQISPIPVSYFIDKSGTIRFVKLGVLTKSDVHALFERLRNENIQ